ncbi:MAG TPA: adenine deaminase [Gemmataceae bacterium]|jgi:adenine deaminase|nr:adenine deaminase [Gemmataceae bacterium]
MPDFELSANVVDVVAGRVFPGTVAVANGRIAGVREEPGRQFDRFIMPGFVDAHVHIESSMMVPSEFARFASVHGTVATVSDPHEIANVLGIEGVRLMVGNGRRVPFKFHWGAPSCVPATTFETSGATLDAAALSGLFDETDLGYLSEVMNFPGVLSGDPEVLAKLRAAKDRGLPIDGHAPGLRGKDVRRYAAAGPSTDHECITLEEGKDRIDAGMKVLIREGSAARNFAALHSLLRVAPDRCLFCTDDLHPDNLVSGHIDRIVARAVAAGHDLFAVLRAANFNAIGHYGLPVGLLRPADPADFILVDDLRDFRVRQTYIDGRLVAADGESQVERVDAPVSNRWGATTKRIDQFSVPSRGGLVRVIEALDGQLVTNELHLPAKEERGRLVADVAADLLKIAVVNRYADAPPAVAFIRGFGLKSGAIASSVAHDSHNIVAVGTADTDLCAAVNALIEAKGGLAMVDGPRTDVMPLEVAGLMRRDGQAAAAGYATLNRLAHDLGSPLRAPFMTLSFMALLVIPALKLGDRGLFDGRAFRFVPLHV